MRVGNKKAFFDYEILETVEAGIVLSGAEAKSARMGQVAMDGAYVKILGDAAWILNMHIYPYKFAATDESYDPTRSRKLLLSADEIVALMGKVKQKNLTIVPTALYTKGPRIKLEIGLARGKKQFEKRETIKKRDIDMDIRRRVR